MPTRMQIPLLVCCLAAVAADANFLTEREWLAKNPGKTRKQFDEMLETYHKKLGAERAEDHETELFAAADLDGDGKHSKDEIVKDLMKVAGFGVDTNGGYIEAGAKETFDKVDKDKDGKITLKEYSAHFKGQGEKEFKLSDTNGDGVHTFEETIANSGDHTKEVVASSEESADWYMKDGDKDKDGKLTKDEKRVVLKAHGAHLDFTAIDANQDGIHTKEEIIASDMRKKGFAQHANGDWGKIDDDVAADFEKLDRNRDGKVTLKEYLKGLPKSNEDEFKEGDYNKDGVHTMDELVNKPNSASVKALKEGEKFAISALKDADKDKDGRVSWEEYRRHALPDEL